MENVIVNTRIEIRTLADLKQIFYLVNKDKPVSHKAFFGYEEFHVSQQIKFINDFFETNSVDVSKKNRKQSMTALALWIRNYRIICEFIKNNPELNDKYDIETFSKNIKNLIDFYKITETELDIAKKKIRQMPTFFIPGQAYKLIEVYNRSQKLDFDSFCRTTILDGNINHVRIVIEHLGELLDDPGKCLKKFPNETKKSLTDSVDDLVIDDPYEDKDEIKEDKESPEGSLISPLTQEEFISIFNHLYYFFLANKKIFETEISSFEYHISAIFSSFEEINSKIGPFQTNQTDIAKAAPQPMEIEETNKQQDEETDEEDIKLEIIENKIEKQIEKETVTAMEVEEPVKSAFLSSSTGQVPPVVQNVGANTSEEHQLLSRIFNGLINYESSFGKLSGTIKDKLDPVGSLYLGVTHANIYKRINSISKIIEDLNNHPASIKYKSIKYKMKADLSFLVHLEKLCSFYREGNSIFYSAYHQQNTLQDNTVTDIKKHVKESDIEKLEKLLKEILKAYKDANPPFAIFQKAKTFQDAEENRVANNKSQKPSHKSQISQQPSVVVPNTTLFSSTTTIPISKKTSELAWGLCQEYLKEYPHTTPELLYNNIIGINGITSDESLKLFFQELDQYHLNSPHDKLFKIANTNHKLMIGKLYDTCVFLGEKSKNARPLLEQLVLTMGIQDLTKRFEEELCETKNELSDEDTKHFKLIKDIFDSSRKMDSKEKFRNLPLCAIFVDQYKDHYCSAKRISLLFQKIIQRIQSGAPQVNPSGSNFQFKSF